MRNFAMATVSDTDTGPLSAAGTSTTISPGETERTVAGVPANLTHGFT